MRGGSAWKSSRGASVCLEELGSVELFKISTEILRDCSDFREVAFVYVSPARIYEGMREAKKCFAS